MRLPRISPLLGLACLVLGAPVQASSTPASGAAALRQDRSADSKPQRRRPPAPDQAQKRKGRPAAERSGLPPLVNPLVDARPLSTKEKLALFDANQNRRLDPAEQLAARQEDQRRKQAMDQLLRDFDADKNGRIGPEESKAVMASVAADRRRQTEAKYDKDRDGRLEPEERAAMLRDLDRARAAVERGEAISPGSPKALAREAAAKRAEALQEAALFLQFDVDKDGKHSPQEAQALAQHQLQQRIARAKAAREEAKTKEGKQGRPTVDVLDPRTLAPLPPPPDPNDPQQQLLKRFDLNGDGVFNQRERRAISEYYARRKAFNGDEPKAQPQPQPTGKRAKQGKGEQPRPKGKASQPRAKKKASKTQRAR